jgi:hypothetical protein
MTKLLTYKLVISNFVGVKDTTRVLQVNIIVRSRTYSPTSLWSK